MNVRTLTEILIKNKKKVCTSRDIFEASGQKSMNLLSNLTNSGWVKPIKKFRGVYYVLDPDEREKKYLKEGRFAILCRCLNTVLGDQWYFGRISAIYLLGIINQPVSEYYIFNRRYSKPIESDMLGKAVFVKTAAKMELGIMRKDYRGIPYNVSSIERTVADYIYLHLNGNVSKEEMERSLKYEISKESLLKTIMSGYPSKAAIKMMPFAMRMGK
jgi:predicted transcriptional regulator of viral defense system